MTVADDLATLRETVWEIAGCGDIRFSHDIDRAKAGHEAALARVEAEIARLERENERLNFSAKHRCWGCSTGADGDPLFRRPRRMT